jgi:hypothetical protein
MSSTRHASVGSTPKDERFASDPSLCRGLKAGDVIRRCEALAAEAEIELALFLQYASNLSGGLEELVVDLVTTFPARLGTPEMHALGVKDELYRAEDVKRVRANEFFGEREYPLKGEVLIGWHFEDDEEHMDGVPRFCINAEDLERHERRAKERAKTFPSSYSAELFTNRCREHFIAHAPELLRTFCVNPNLPLHDVVLESFRDLPTALLTYLDIWERKALADVVVTQLGKKVIEALDYTEGQRDLTLVEGYARTGKSFIAQAWAKARPGRRRIVSLSEASSEKVFFREIAQALGAAAGHGYKGNEIRERVNDILRAGHLTLVIDEAHWLWPSRNLREAVPRRIEWVRCSLNNHGVPVAMIATHQFTRSHQVIEKNTKWSSEQLIGRIGFCARLPDQLERDDIASVVRYHLPAAEERTVTFLVNYVIGSKKYLAAVDHMVRAARHEARKAGRDRVTHRDVMLGFDNTVVPSDAQMAAMSTPSARPLSKPRGKASKVFTTASLAHGNPLSASDLPERGVGAALKVSNPDRVKRSTLASPAAA